MITKEPDSVVLILSGGMDSATLLHRCLERGIEVKLALSFDYGQRHIRELECARELAERANIAHTIARLPLSQLAPTSALTSNTIEVPTREHYASDAQRATVVPGRNMLMLSLAAACAIGHGAEAVAYGAHGGDHHIYPDCRPEFVDAMNAALGAGNTREPEGPVWIYAPFLRLDKEHIAAEGDRLGVPWEATWTCYEGGELHCGVCGSCNERREAFDHAGIGDGVRYAIDEPR